MPFPLLTPVTREEFAQKFLLLRSSLRAFRAGHSHASGKAGQSRGPSARDSDFTSGWLHIFLISARPRVRGCIYRNRRKLCVEPELSGSGLLLGNGNEKSCCRRIKWLGRLSGGITWISICFDNHARLRVIRSCFTGLIYWFLREFGVYIFLILFREDDRFRHRVSGRVCVLWVSDLVGQADVRWNVYMIYRVYGGNSIKVRY